MLIIEQPVPSLSPTPVTALDARTVFPTAQPCQANLKPGSRRLAATMRLVVAAGSLWLSVWVPSFAQPAKPIPSPTVAIKPPAVVTAAKPVVSKPVWAELTVQQQIALRPLSPGWDTISEAQKRKWLEISKGYPSLTPELTPEEKQAKWQSYQTLSAEEKQKLAAKATPKPTGAATAVKPVSPQKLAVTRSAQAPQGSKVPPDAATPSAPAVPGGDADNLQKR